jgi:hypothetical protein
LQTNVTGGVESLKGYHRMGDYSGFVKNYAPLALINEVISTEITFSQAHLDGQYL